MAEVDEIIAAGAVAELVRAGHRKSTAVFLLSRRLRVSERTIYRRLEHLFWPSLPKGWTVSERDQ